MSNTFARINNAAHTGALGNNRLPMPSTAQLDAGNYAKGHIRINGLDIAIENPAYTYRKSTDKTGQQWSCLMQAHYGYINGYKGNDGDNVDVFVGNVPENDTAYIINQKTQGGFFDEHKVMLGFLSQQQAVDTYQHCFERGWTGLMSVVPCTMSQLKWWLANGDKARPVTKERLPYAGLERLDSVVWGGTDEANLYSHGGQLSKLLYQIRLDDVNNQALEPLAYHDMIAELGNQGFMYENYDALIVEYNKLERKAKQLLMVMQGAADTVKPVGVTVSKPLTKNGVSNVIAWFEMDDGQAVGVFFHNPDKNPKKLDPTDEMISYKWVLNKKDITIAVAPENGKDVIIRTVAKRIMQLVEKNHDRFAKANSDKAELNQKEQSLGQLVIEKQSQLDALNDDIKTLEAQKAEKEANKAPTAEELTKQGFDGIATELKKLGWTDDLVMGGLTKSFIGAKESGSVNEDGVLNVNVSRENGLIRAQVGADTLIPNSVDNIPQYGLNAQTEQSYKKVADKVNNAVDAYVEQRKVAVAGGQQDLLAGDNQNDKEDVYSKDFDAGLIAGVEKKIIAGGWLKSKKSGRWFSRDMKFSLGMTNNGGRKIASYLLMLAISDDFDGVRTFTDIKGGNNELFFGKYSKNPNMTADEIYEFIASRTTQAEQVVEPTTQERPSNWRTNLANARAVAKSLGIETKGKKLHRLLREIDIFDEKEVKKELLSEFKALASRLVLPKGYVFDLSDAEKSIDDITRWVSPIIKQKGAFDFNKIRIELRAVTSINEYEGGVYISDYVFFYTEDKKAKAELDKLNYPNDGNINASEPKTPKATVEKMEEFLIKAVFPKIEYLKVLNSTDVDVSKLSEIGIAEITDIGNENLYFEKDGKYYVSKVGNPQLYALGEWDFAKYPEGKPATVAPVAQPNNTLQKDISKSELFKDANVWAIDDFGKENGMVIYSRDEQDGFSIGIVDKLKQVNMQYTDIDTDQQTNESFSTENITNEQVIEKIKMFIAKHEQKSVELSPVQTVSEPPLTDFALVTFNAWKKGGKHRIYLKVSENDNDFNEMDYGANDLGYLEVVGKNGSEKINNLSTVSNYSKLKDKVIGSAFISALQEYLSQKDIDISDFNGATLKVKIKSDADVLTEKQAAIDAQANAEAQAKQAKQDKTDLQQAIIKENIDKFGRDVVVNDLSDAVLGNKAKVEAILAGTFLMSDKDFNSFLSFQKSAKPIITNHPDRDYLQSIIDGEADPLTIDFDALIALAEKYDGDKDMNPLIDDALEVINKAQQAASEGV